MLGIFLWIILIISVIIEVKEIHKHTQQIEELKAEVYELKKQLESRE